jgi:enoyl-CoA hydratase
MGMDEILFERRGGAGLIVLNRPQALNALTYAMIRALRAQLEEWEADSGIEAVVIRGAGPRAFCSGGDIRAFYESASAGTPYVREFWQDEYALNAYIKHYPKPYIALIHGICMGGGLGVSVHGAYRVIAENAVMAWPETGIGFFPDVGANYVLPRCPGEIGTYLALTGARARARDALHLGLATHVLGEDRWPDFLEALASGEPASDLLRTAGAKTGEAPLIEHRALIDAAFAAPTVEEILARLDAAGGGFARETANLLRSRSPTSLKVALHAQREGKLYDFDGCMKMEFRIACRMAEKPDFREGVRAVIIDKDNKPAWLPRTLNGVPEQAVTMCFAPLAESELRL